MSEKKKTKATREPKAAKAVKGNGKARTLAGAELLTEAPPGIVSDLDKKCRWLSFEESQIIVDRDDDSTDVYFIIEGKVKIMDFLADDQEIALAELGPGASFGELSAVDASKRSARVTALEDTTLATITSSDFRDLLMEVPGISIMLLKRFAGLIRTLNTRITALSTMTPHQRVYYELIRMSEPNPQGDGSWVIHYLPKHEEIASWSGTSREDVAMAIGHLAREGIVGRKHKSLIIKDHDRLQMLLNL
ncbi:MAG: Crp/Fnr family transcriptional regulator [Rhodospirillaceae bacterium]|nr:Crp/Fnr family transcriptional regulator [Rhodospirillaceae bacterium]